ncbi:hypothetical protein Q8F55_005411 [Vanrija albida]|uniref:OPT family small oligopeptide transporter n=1 Tax=Vanrija albida TaxID=181172 RepID=A0ABR3Q1S0_9TREE
MVEARHDRKDSTEVKEKHLDSGYDVNVFAPHREELDDAIGDLVRNGDVTRNELVELEERLDTMPLERTIPIIRQLYKLNKNDQNFDTDALFKMEDFLFLDVQQHPELHAELIHEMRLEALLATENSPFAIVRAVADPTDDRSLPALTIRVWIIGILFSGIGSFVNQLFSQRQPGIAISVSTAQLVAYPLGRLFEKVLPDWGFTAFGKRHSLNPGRFNLKEHMLITIMANASFGGTYAMQIIFTQSMPFYFDQPFARKFGYQILNTLGANFSGYGMAGLIRRFVVFPSFAIWPQILPTLALNKAFHADDTDTVPGPFGRTYNWSRLKVFLVLFVAMFVWFWIPDFIFQALSTFNWMAWIAPDNAAYTAIVATNFGNGLGLNPWPTFDWNWLSIGPDTPLFAAANLMLGMFLGFFMIIAFWFSNAYNTAYFPINTNRVYDNRGKTYNVSRILTPEKLFDYDKYQQYSQPYMAAGNIVAYFWFFALYSASRLLVSALLTVAITYAVIFHRHEVAYSFRASYNAVKSQISSIWKKSQPKEELEDDEKASIPKDDLAEDIHYRLAQQYKEVPEWWYFIVLLFGLGIGMAGVGAYPTNVNMAVVIFGIILTAIFIVPIALINSITTMETTLNVLAEFIGGSLVPGNALSMNFFKMYGVMTADHAISFSKDLKLAHYVHIDQRYTFATQLVATLVASFVEAAIFNFMMSFKGVCTPDAAWQMTCPGTNTFFTASVFWGTLGPPRVFGLKGPYRTLLIGFAVGFLITLAYLGLRKLFPRSKLIRNLHPVGICYGGIQWSPYNLSMYIPGFYVILFSWGYLKRRYLAFWSRYNYILVTAFNAGIAVSAIIIFFGVQIPGASIEWWGNDPEKGCHAAGCRLKEIPERGYIGPEKGHYN